MNESVSRLEIQELRELFLGAPASDTARILAVVGSLGLAALVLYLVRRRALREEYTPIWMGVSAGLLLLSLSETLLRDVTRAVGAWTQSSTLFFLGEVFLVIICLNFAVRLSRTGVQMRCLAQELALLRTRLDALGQAGECEDPPRREPARE
jgi:hypothetical protein